MKKQPIIAQLEDGGLKMADLCKMQSWKILFLKMLSVNKNKLNKKRLRALLALGVYENLIFLKMLSVNNNKLNKKLKEKVKF